MPADVTLRFQVHKQCSLPGPLVESPAGRKLESEAADGEWIVVESSNDVAGAARAATSRMIDLLVDRWGFSAVHAYLLCSVAMNLRFSQVVNEPIFTISAAISKEYSSCEKAFLTRK